MQFLSDDWVAALDAAARDRRPPDGDDPLSGVHLTIDQVVPGVRTWRLVIDDGVLRVLDDPSGEPDIRLTSELPTAVDIAAGRRSALAAFIAGDLVLGGDVQRLLEEKAALEALGDLFAEVKASTAF